MNDEERQPVPQARQLKIKGLEGKGEPKKEPKEKEKPGSKWVIVGILFVLIIAALIFKFTSGVSEQTSDVQSEMAYPASTGTPTPRRSGAIFGPAEFNYTK